MLKFLRKPQTLLVLPAALALAGCGSSTESTTDIPAGVAGATPPSATTAATPEKPAETVVAPKTAPTPAAPTKGYTVVDEGQPGFPPDVLAALKKAKVPPPPANLTVPKRAKLEIDTVKGKITIELNADAAPLHAKSFYYLAKRGFFNGLTFHRYEEGFVIQGGDPLSKNPKFGAPYASVTGSPAGFHGTGGPGYRVPREYNNLKHGKFVLSMARSNDPDSAGSQFFITLADTPQLDQENTPDRVGYTVFGKVLKGQDVVMKIRAGDKINKVKILG